MNYIWQATSSISSWFYGNGAAATTTSAAGKQASAFAALSNREALRRPLGMNYDVAFNDRNLRGDKVRVRQNLAAAADKVGVAAVRKAIVKRLGDTGVHQAVARQQLHRVVREAAAGATADQYMMVSPRR